MREHITSLRRGRSPNCSATGSVVGAALLSAIATAAIVNAFADRFLAWLQLDPSVPEPAPPAAPTPSDGAPTAPPDTASASSGAPTEAPLSAPTEPPAAPLSAPTAPPEPPAAPLSTSFDAPAAPRSAPTTALGAPSALLSTSIAAPGTPSASLSAPTASSAGPPGAAPDAPTITASAQAAPADLCSVPRLREEASGGILAWPDPPALLFLDPVATRAAARAGAHLIGGAPAPAGALSAPTEVHLALTSRCPVRCTACYLDAGPEREPPGGDDLQQCLSELAALGVLEIALGGGEALLRDDLLDVADAIRSHGMVPNLTTSGLGLTPELAARMAGRFGQINVSIDGLGPSYRAVRGFDGASRALHAVELLIGAGIRVGINTVLTRHNHPTLGELGRALAQRGVAEWQWLRLKPSGRGRTAYAELALHPAQAEALWPLALELEAEIGLTIRWDCALVPFLATHGLPPGRLARLGVVGCPGGHSLLTRHADGAWAPCSFTEGAPAPSAAAAWADDPALGAWRERAEQPAEPCASCSYQPICRGGCRIVAAHVHGDPLAPDPECPRVAAWSAS